VTKKFRPERKNLLHLGSLITYKSPDGLEENCLGDIMVFEGHGAFDPTLGRVDVTKEEAELHNKALSDARLKGLDENCQIGQGNFAYLSGKAGNYRVQDFIGAQLNDVDKPPHVSGKTVTFERKGKKFRGRLQKDGDNFNYRRIE
jgi:hypothetical protein